MKPNLLLSIYIASILAVVLSSCEAIFPAPTPTPTLTPTFTPTNTSTSTPTSTPTPTLTPTPTRTPNVYEMLRTTIVYYLIRDLPGKKGECNFQPVPILTYRAKGSDLESDVAYALSTLFGFGSENYGSLANPLSKSRLSVVSVEYSKGNNLLTIYLTGGVIKTREKCDNSRMRAQVWSTVRQFEGFKKLIIWVDGKLLGDLLANDK